MQKLIYADDPGIATQSERSEDIEHILTGSLTILGEYYRTWFLNANPSEIQVCPFHLEHCQAKQKPQILWDGTILEH